MKRGISVLLTLCVLLGSLTACSSTPGTGQSGSSSESQEPKILHAVANAGATIANPLLATVESDTDLAGYITSGLYGYIPNEDGKGSILVPMLAESEPVDVNGDGTVWQIAIRKDAQWSNGDPINADTFIYSWKMCLDPVLLMNKASALASTYATILNAKEYYSQATTGTKVDWESVGLKKIDEYTVEVTTDGDFSQQEVMRQFNIAASYPVYELLFEAGMNADRSETTYGTELSQIMSCGTFTLTEWVKGSEYKLEKNESWPYADMIKLDGMTVRAVEDKGTQQQMFDAGELDYVLLDGAGVEKYAEDPRLTPGTSGYIRMIDICDTNPNQPILANLNFKKALFYSIDRETIATLANKMPCTWLVPITSVAYADGTTFRSLDIAKEYLPENYGYDPEYAKECFDKALEETGLSKVELSITYGTTSADFKVIVEYLQEAWPQIFGADRFVLNLNGMPNAQSLELRKSSPTNPEAYELGCADWSVSAGKYNPIKALEVFTSTYSRRNAPYHCDAADALYEQSLDSSVRKDEKKLAEVTAAMEKALLEEVAVIPVLENRTFYMFSDDIQLVFEEQDPSLAWGIKFADLNR